MLSNIAFFLFAPVFLIAGIIYGSRTTFGRQAQGLPVWALVALSAGSGMYAVAFAPLLVFLFDRARPEFQGHYYSSIKFLALGGWLATLGAVLWESIRRGPSWQALGISLWATVSFFSCLIATMFMVAVQV